MSVYSLDYTGGGGRRPPLAVPCCFPDTWQRRWQRRRLTSNPWVPSRRAPWTYKAAVQVRNYLTLLPNNPHTEKKLCDLVTSSMNVFVWQILNFQPNANLLVSITVDKHFTLLLLTNCSFSLLLKLYEKTFNKMFYTQYFPFQIALVGQTSPTCSRFSRVPCLTRQRWRWTRRNSSISGWTVLISAPPKWQGR